MTIELRVLSGTRAGTREEFSKAVVTVGRDPMSDLRFDPHTDLDVSSRHAELRHTNGVWTIHDLGSTNGISSSTTNAWPTGIGCPMATW